MLVICTSAQSNFAFSLESFCNPLESRFIRLISLNCTGLWISYTDIVLDSRAVHKLGSWCFCGHETNASLELVGWRLVSFYVNWEQDYMFRQALWFQTKISIPWRYISLFLLYFIRQTHESAEGLSNYTDAPHTSRVWESRSIPKNKGSECWILKHRRVPVIVTHVS